jgi:hypothetical protein
MTLRVAHSGTVHEFLLLHFRMGHIKYGHLLHGLKAGYWKGFQHNLNNIRLEDLPVCPIYKIRKMRHKSYSDIPHLVQLIAPWSSLPHGYEDPPSLLLLFF